MSRLMAVMVTVLLSVSCTRSGALVRLAPGDPVHGREVFLKFECHSCHAVSGDAGMPAPVADPPVPIALGGPRGVIPSQSELATSIANPSLSVPGSHAAAIATADGRSRMPDPSDSLSVRELADVTAYVHSLYELEPRRSAGVR